MSGFLNLRSIFCRFVKSAITGVFAGSIALSCALADIGGGNGGAGGDGGEGGAGDPQLGGWLPPHLLRPMPPQEAVPASPLPRRAAPQPRPGAALLTSRIYRPATAELRHRQDEVLVELPSDIAPATFQAIANRHALEPLEQAEIALFGTTIHRMRILDGRDVRTVLGVVAGDPRIIFAQPNFLFEPANRVILATAHTASAPDQYAVERLRLADAHGLATGAGVKVAVIDSGIDTSHSALTDAVYAQFDAVEGEIAPAHGTGVAGIIAARMDYVGVAPGAQLLSVRAFAGRADGSAEGATFNLLRGIDWAHAEAAKVFNLSFAGPRDVMLGRALASLVERGAILIAAAGNNGPKAAPVYPAAELSVIAVTAVDADDRLFAAANRGRYISLAAPGVDVLVPAPENRFVFRSGTSMAAAHVSGLAALLLERAPDLDSQRLEQVLRATARRLGRSEMFGAGRIDAFDAVQAVHNARRAAR